MAIGGLKAFSRIKSGNSSYIGGDAKCCSREMDD
jgi:hypothetical protein